MGADVWNQRIRKVSNEKTSCLYTQPASAAQVAEYSQALEKVQSNCSTMFGDAELAETQRRVVDEMDPYALDSTLCQYAGAAGLGTNSTLVLCRICELVETNLG